MSKQGGKKQPSRRKSKLLILHGSRQVGQLLVGRMDKLRKKLQKGYATDLVAPDGPFLHPGDEQMRQWWIRNDSEYQGLDQTLDLIQETWNANPELEGILGFSQGARLAHLLIYCHESPHHPLHLEGLAYAIMCAGYEAPIPTNLQGVEQDRLLQTPSLHVYGLADKLIPASQSRLVAQYYENGVTHEHDGGHHVPMRAANVEAYLSFIGKCTAPAAEVATAPSPSSSTRNSNSYKANKPTQSSPPPPQQPDEEAMMAQQDEVEALSAIYPDEFRLLSKKKNDDEYAFPISYQIDIPASDEGIWPPHPISLEISYPHNYPAETMANIRFVHDNNVMEFSSGQREACFQGMKDGADAEVGMPSVLTCVYAARDFFESGAMENVKNATATAAVEPSQEENGTGNDTEKDVSATSGVIKPSSPERIKECNLQGLEIARTILQQSTASDHQATTNSSGGTWKYTCGLVGKPSAGKSTFFNAATAFARQRNDADNAIGGATMAPHPFTTIGELVVVHVSCSCV